MSTKSTKCKKCPKVVRGKNQKLGFCSECQCGKKAGRGICRKQQGKCNHGKSKASAGGSKKAKNSPKCKNCSKGVNGKNQKLGFCSKCQCGKKAGRGICRKQQGKCNHGKSKASAGGSNKAKKAAKGDKANPVWVTHVTAKGPRGKDEKLLNPWNWKKQYIGRYGESEFKNCACVVGEPYFADGEKKKPLNNCSGDIVGAHVTLKKSDGSGAHYIVPMCNIHNDTNIGQINGGKDKLYSVKVSKCIAMKAVRE